MMSSGFGSAVHDSAVLANVGNGGASSRGDNDDARGVGACAGTFKEGSKSGTVSDYSLGFRGRRLTILLG